MESFLPVASNSHFPIQNLPFGIFSQRTGTPAAHHRRVGVALGDHVVDLAQLAAAGLFSGPHLAGSTCFAQGELNSFMALGRPAWREARATLQRLLSAGEAALRDNARLRAAAIIPQADVTMHLPAAIGDYTDFYASREHAVNCGTIFRGRDVALAENWLHLPVGYHGRASSVVVSGTPVRRPWGQVLPKGASSPTFSPSSVLDYELEMAALLGPGCELGGSGISVDAAEEHMFGLVLMNDWSARDIQKWEYVPLGPFNGKNWATSISPWVVTLDALEPFRCEAPGQEPQVAGYLREARRSTYDIRLEVALQAGAGEATTVTRSNLRHLYWTLPQMVAHHSAGGCNLQPGDLLGTGTISAADGEAGANEGLGSLLEMSWGGARSITLAGGAQRTFLQDGDSVTLTGWAQGAGFRVGFGQCSGIVLPAHAR